MKKIVKNKKIINEKPNRLVKILNIIAKWEDNIKDSLTFYYTC